MTSSVAMAAAYTVKRDYFDTNHQETLYDIDAHIFTHEEVTSESTEHLTRTRLTKL